jgi:hypothetical protein
MGDLLSVNPTCQRTTIESGMEDLCRAPRLRLHNSFVIPWAKETQGLGPTNNVIMVEKT